MAKTIYTEAVKGNIKGVKRFLFPKLYHFKKPVFIEKASDEYNGASPEIKKCLGYTTLMIAVQFNHKDLVQYLLDIGADKYNGKDLFTKNGTYNPLMVAASIGNIEIATILINDFKLIKDLLHGNNMVKPTEEFLQKQESYYKTNKVEIETSAKESHKEYVNNIDKLGNTALIYAALNNQNSMVEFLIENGADINISNNEGLNTISYALLNRNLDLIKFLKERGVDLNKDTKDEPLLNITVRIGDLLIFKYIQKENPDINKMYNGESPITLAVKNRNLKILKELINLKADLSVKDGEGNTLLNLAINTKDKKIIKTLQDAGIKSGIDDIKKYNAVLNKINPHERIDIDTVMPALEGIELNPTKSSTSAIFNLIKNCSSEYDTDYGEIREKAFEVLAKINDPQIIKKLIKNIEDIYVSIPIKVMSLSCLYHVDKDRSIEYLTNFISNSDLGPMAAELMLKFDEIPEKAVENLSISMGQGQINAVNGFHHKKAAIVLGKSKNKKALKPLRHLLEYYEEADFYDVSFELECILNKQIDAINKLLQ